MGGARYFVWGAGSWRELDTAAGRVAGWRRRARFVFVRRGRLCVARGRDVLSALRALAAGRPGAAADGPRLQHRSKSAVVPNKRRRETPGAPAAAPAGEHRHCCAHFNGCNNNTKAVNYPLPPLVTAAPLLVTATSTSSAQQTREAGTQCGRGEGGAHAITIKPAHTVRAPRGTSSGEDFVSTPRRKLVPTLRSNTSDVNSLLGEHRPAGNTALTPSPTPETQKTRAPLRNNNVGSDVRNKTEPLAAGKPGPTNAIVSDSSCERRNDECKELIIPESDVAALRSFVERNRSSALERFDADDEYKRALFYAINPLVQLERCRRLERALFAARLGLAPSAASSPTTAQRRPKSHRGRSLSADTDKENKEAKNTSSNREGTQRIGNKQTSELLTMAREPTPRTTRTGGARLGVSECVNKETVVVSKTTEADEEAGGARPGEADRRNKDAAAAGKPASKPPFGAHVISKRAVKSGAKEYSNLEDHAIVAWVSGGSRASLVNGNRLWRDLEEQYPRLTGQKRSWHSLRNRYLRYILPALGALRLAPAHASRLRAAAASGGVVKRRQLAAAGRAPPPRRASILSSEPPTRGASSRRPRPRSPSSEEDTPLRPTTTANNHDNGVPSQPRRSLRSHAQEEAAPPRSGAAPRSPRYSEVTRRFAARRPPHSSSSSPAPAPASPPSPRPHAPRSRRLYNPNTRI